MGRMHAKEKGQSHSTRPVTALGPNPRPPYWVKMTKSELEALILKLAKRNIPPSQIGLILRDQYGIPLVKPILGQKLVKFLRSHGYWQFPEDLYFLIEKAKRIKRHLAVHKKDYVAKRRLILTEAKIHRLVKYYKRKGILPENFDYKERISVFA